MKTAIWIGCMLIGATALAKPKKAATCDGVKSTTKPAWCIKPPPGYELDPPNGTGEPGDQVFRDKASNQAFNVSSYPKAGGVEGVLKRLRADVPAEGGKEIKEESTPGGKLLRYKASHGPTIVLVMASAGPGPTPDTERVVTCRVNLAETHAEFAKQLAACKTLKVMP